MILAGEGCSPGKPPIAWLDLTQSASAAKWRTHQAGTGPRRSRPMKRSIRLPASHGRRKPRLPCGIAIGYLTTDRSSGQHSTCDALAARQTPASAADAAGPMPLPVARNRAPTPPVRIDLLDWDVDAFSGGIAQRTVDEWCAAGGSVAVEPLRRWWPSRSIGSDNLQYRHFDRRANKLRSADFRMAVCSRGDLAINGRGEAIFFFLC